MLTEKDIKKMVQVFPTKEDFRRLKDLLAEVESSIQYALSELGEVVATIEKRHPGASGL